MAEASAPAVNHNHVIMQPGGEMALGQPVIAKPAYPDQRAPPPVLFGASPVTANAPYVYAQPQGFRPSQHAAALATATPIGHTTGDDQPPTAQGTPVAQATPVAYALPFGTGGGDSSRTSGLESPHGFRMPQVEMTADFTNGDLTSTGEADPVGDPRDITHANFFWNDIVRVDGLERFPNLVRLTLSGNRLTSLQGVHACPHLRWLDVSINDLRDLSGLARVDSLEWLDAQENRLRTLDGLGFAPNLTWLNVRNSDLISLGGLRNLPGLRVLDASKNLLGTTAGVAHCPRLIELNVATNNLTDLSGVDTLAQLRALDAADNELDRVPLLRGLTVLHTLSLAHNNLGARNVPEVLESLGGLPGLRVVKLGRNAFSDEDLARIGRELSAAAEAAAGPGHTVHVDNSATVAERSVTHTWCACAVS